MVETKFKDNLVRLFLGDECVLEQDALSKITIGTYSAFVEDDVVEKKDYDTAYVGKGASLTDTTVNSDGVVYVDDGGMLGLISLDGGSLSGAPICVNASRWYGGAICLTATGLGEDAKGSLILSGGTFSGCSAIELNDYAGTGGAVETYGGTFSVQDALFVNNSTEGVGGSGGAIALLYTTSTVTGGTFSGNSAYFGGAIQQNAGTLAVTGAQFIGNKSVGETVTAYSPGGGALELHNGAETIVTGSTFTANTAMYGGAVFNDTYNTAVSTASVADSVFDANSATLQGGAIYNYADLTVTNSVFDGNFIVEDEATTWSSFGGAIANTKNGSLTVIGGKFDGNSAVQGGAIATFIDYGSADSANLTVVDADFSLNASTYGGGIYVQTGTTDATVVTGGTFTANSASYGGGAICRCFGLMIVTGSEFVGNTAGNDGGAISFWDSWDTGTGVADAKFTGNTALYGGAISHSWASAPVAITGSTFTANGGEKTLQGGAIWNDAFSTGVVTVSGCTFDGNTAAEGGAIYNAGNMKLGNVVLATASDTVVNAGSLAFTGANTLGASVINNGNITLSVAADETPLLNDLGKITGDGSILLKLSAEALTAGTTFAAAAGTFTGSLDVKVGDGASGDAFTLADGALKNDLAFAGSSLLRLAKAESGALSVKTETLADLVPVASADGSILAWTNSAGAPDGYWVEIAQGKTFDNAIRIATDGTAFDVASASGAYSCQVTQADGEFTADATAWTTAASGPKQVVSNGNGRSDVFFATVADGDVWTAKYQAKNTVTGETAAIAGKNRIRDTFTGSASDANILYLTDAANGDALFMDDIYSEFGEAARLSLIREVRAGAGDDVVDMTGIHYTANLAGMTARGGSGDDILWGAEGGNSLFGDAGNDIISGGTGDDLIAGGAGDDILKGGGGNDTFTFCVNWGTDVISQAAGGKVALWFAEDKEAITTSELDGNAIFTDGVSKVTVEGFKLADVEVHYGNDGSDQCVSLNNAGAFLDSSAESVFESHDMRLYGILASL